MPGKTLLLTGLLFAAAPAWAANHTVTVGGSAGQLTFTPNDLSISAGDTVTFTNAGGFHNVVSDPGAPTSFRCAAGCDGTGGDGTPSGTAWSATVTFPTPGDIGYHCEVHQASGTVGVIHVAVPVDLQSFSID
jgi:plastocyanin